MKKIFTILLIFIFLILQNNISACTGFTASQGDKVLFGNNEDWFDPDPYIIIHPSEYNRYGRLYIEFRWPPENPRYYVSFTGINDQGLCFDSFLHPQLLPTQSREKPYFNGDIMEYCLETCSKVEEVIHIFNSYNLEFMENFQYFIVDRFGNSAIIEGDEIIYKNRNFQVITNFLQSNPSHGWYPCWRYEKAVEMLENMENLSVEYFTEICNATHQEGSYPTIYSYVNDLESNMMYLYHYYDYNKKVVIDINEEIQKGYHSYYLPDLFSDLENQPPLIPNEIYGEINGKINVEYEYETSTKDPDKDKILYLFDWGDGNQSGWLGPYESEEIIITTHSWEKEGSYEIMVKAKDIYGYESNWSDPLYVSMPKIKTYENNIIYLNQKNINLFWIIKVILKDILY
jgi:hypothetical protein